MTPLDAAPHTPAEPAWIAADWGTTRLRVWAMDEDDQVLAHRAADLGMSGLDRADFEPALLKLVGDWLTPGRTKPVLVCGMAGARQGWVEAPYRTVPCPAAGQGGLATAPATDPGIAVRIVPGVKQQTPPDVMRGEETQIAGFLGSAPGFDGMICLPGTHTKWVDVANGQIRGFRTFMTGEVFGLLTEKSVLRHSVGAGWCDAAFDAAVAQTLTQPETCAADLFAVRAAGLVGDSAPETAAPTISGLLIGMELAAALGMLGGRPVTVIGNSRLASLYARALDGHAHSVTMADVDQVTLNGLIAVRAVSREAFA